MHCLSRTPSTKKSQLGSNYSALTLKFGALESARMTTLNRNHFMIPSQNTSELIEIQDARHIDEVRTFACRAEDVSPFMMDNSYKSTVKINPTGEPVNFSCSQQTTMTTLSRDNSLKHINPKMGRSSSSEKVLTKQPPDNRKNSFAETLKRCTQKVLIFKTDMNTSMTTSLSDGKVKIKKKVSNDSIKSSNTISNSSLKEIDEEEFTSSELAQMMCEINNGIRHAPTS